MVLLVLRSMLVPPTATTLGDEAGALAVPAEPASPVAAKNVTPWWPLGVAPLVEPGVLFVCLRANPILRLLLGDSLAR
jgi:hypothetical protein